MFIIAVGERSALPYLYNFYIVKNVLTYFKFTVN